MTGPGLGHAHRTGRGLSVGAVRGDRLTTAAIRLSGQMTAIGLARGYASDSGNPESVMPRDFGSVRQGIVVAPRREGLVYSRPPRSPSWVTIANSLSGSTRQLWQTAFALSSHASQPPSSGGSATRPAEPLIQFRSTSPEGCGLNADRQLARHLTIALGSANELQDIVDAFERRGRLDPSDLDLPAEISRIRAMLAGLHKRVASVNPEHTANSRGR